ncbi:response regulator [Desulforamulus hydrothermalis]|uniref:Stage 0 sporulation protein A homolog n=1 Tax=Desulforamulus hydrothermalis Lam5 = DSM 18033 TaxID=1121428 RepID=K8ECH2_9FIRM|nr:response regulator transcription factor [Desulforamulus hydrothermalis]CCO09368.1 DNA-binding response regulator in two-component system with YedV [Desulforamulus hydrothermalis Lam5 = DSM 18033]SHH32003.1 two-component system, OmpR family, response regulator ResD [Desulforamulus hydrothermalis Lam5 = DSM 18033]
MPRVLLVDDEEKIRDLVKVYLEKDGFTVVEHDSGSGVVDMVTKNSYDLLLLDLMLPGVDGLTLCKEVRKTSQIPIIMLTAKGEEIDRVLGLEVGADDYIVKPFSPRELVARVKAVLRRSHPDRLPVEKKPAVLAFPQLVINPESRTVEFQGKDITLTPREFDLLLYLAKSPGRAFSRETLLENVWGYNYYGDLRTVDTHINRLRDKLNVQGGKQLIVTVWGVGYKFEVPK